MESASIYTVSPPEAESSGAAGAPAKVRRAARRLLLARAALASLLVILGAATAAGTFTAQGLPADVFAARYERLAPLRVLRLEDVFHSPAFRAVLACAALLSGLLFARRSAWRSWRPVPICAGLAAVLAGGLLATLGGARGFLDLRQGEVASSFERHDPWGHATGESVPLGFGVRLDGFAAARGPIEWWFCVRETRGGKTRPALSRTIAEAGEWTETGVPGAEFRARRVFPEYATSTDFLEAAPGGGEPGALITVFGRDGQQQDLVLKPDDPKQCGVLFPRQKTLLQIYRTEADVKVQTEPTAECHLLIVGATKAEVPLKVGDTCDLPDNSRLTAVAFFPDFGWDGATKTAHTRSPEPKNPALQVSIRFPDGETESRFLFAGPQKMEIGTGQRSQAFQLAYRYEPEVKPPDRWVALIVATRELLDYRHGALVGRSPAPSDSSERIARGVPAVLIRLLESGIETHTPITLSREWRHPAAEIEIRRSGAVDFRILEAGERLDLKGEGRFLDFEPKPADVRSFRSSVAILQGDVTSFQDVLTVDRPVFYGGYAFYQSRFGSEDPSCSSLLVVKQPAVGMLLAGFAVLALGVVGTSFSFSRKTGNVP